LLLCVLAGCSHDAKRENPLDPELTPPVSLEGRLDVSQGTVELSWSAYDGTTSFETYHVLRKVQGLEAIDTLSSLPGLADTTFIDSSTAPNTSHEYQILVETTPGLQTPSNLIAVSGYTVVAPVLTSVVGDGRGAKIVVTWSPYNGPRFEAYRIERAESVRFDTVGQVTDRATGSFSDTSVLPETSYVYRVVLQAAGLEYVSNLSTAADFSLRPVTLESAILDSITGGVELQWRAYDGQGFVVYQVMREQITGMGREPELVARLDEIADTVTVIRDLIEGERYGFSVVTITTRDTLVGNQLQLEMRRPRLTGFSAELQHETFAIELNWDPYTGPFGSYLIIRSSDDEEIVLARLTNVENTRFVDSTSRGDVTYAYRVEVETPLGERVSTSPVTGINHHRFQDEWNLDVASDEYLRLSAGPDTLVALLTSLNRLRLMYFDYETGYLGGQDLGDAFSGLVPSASSTAIDEDGRRLVSFLLQPVRGDATTVVAHIGPDGLEYEGDLRPFGLTDTGISQEIIDSVKASPPPNRILVSTGVDGAIGKTIILDDDTPVDVIEASDVDVAPRPRIDVTGSWSNPGVVTELRASHITTGTGAWIELGGSSRSTGGHVVRFGRDTAGDLNLSYRPTFIDPIEGVTYRFGAVPSPFVPGLWYRIRLQFRGGVSPLSYQPRYAWGLTSPDLNHITSSVLVAHAGNVFLTHDGESLRLQTPGEPPIAEVVSPLRSQLSGPSTVSDVALWHPGTGSSALVAACSASEHKVFFGRLTITKQSKIGRLGSFTKSIGRAINGDPGSFIFPLSAAATEDGTLYVLDSGNARIQVFDGDQNYLTEFGGPGTEPGTFDFGRGTAATDFTGSVAVGPNGKVYVAEVNNARIQIFGP
jgi:hypothetical protein